VRADCDDGRIKFTVAISNASIEPTGTHEAKIDLKLDSYVDHAIVDLIGNANRFSFMAYKSNYFASATQFLIGIPINGSIAILRISLKEPTVVNFVSKCAVVQSAVEKEAAQAQAQEKAREAAEKQRKQAEEAAEQARIREQNERFQKTLAEAKAACVPGRMMRTRVPTSIQSLSNYDNRRAPSGAVVLAGTLVQVVAPSELGLPSYTHIPDADCVVKTNNAIGTVMATQLTPAQDRQALDQQAAGPVPLPPPTGASHCFVRVGANCLAPY
jgi:hypothetical protein